MSDALTDPRGQALLNTSPSELDTLATQFSRVSGQAQTSADGLRGAHGDLNWTGTSADGFRTQLGKLPSDLDTVHGSYSQIAGALHAYATHVEPIRSKFSTITQQLSADSQSLSTAQTSASSAQTAYNSAATAKDAKPTDTAVTGAHTTLTTAQGKVSQLQGQVSGLNAQALRLLDEFDTVRGQCITQIKGAAGQAPQHHSSFWGSLGHIASSVGHFVGSTVVHIAKQIADLPAATVNLVEHPSWEALGRFGEDLAAAGTVVAMAVAPFAAPELLEADGGLEAAETAGEVATDAATDTAADTAGDTSESLFSKATSAAKDKAVQLRDQAIHDFHNPGDGARDVSNLGLRAGVNGQKLNVLADAGQGHYKNMAIDAAFLYAPNGRTFASSSADFKTVGDRIVDRIGVGDTSAEEAKASAEKVLDYQKLRTANVPDKLAKQTAFGDDPPNGWQNYTPRMRKVAVAATQATDQYTHAARIALHVGRPAAIAIDKFGTESLQDQFKGPEAGEPVGAGAAG
jgi:uncharacterized protein YukE